MEKQRDFKVFSGFILKIIAIISMTLDHVGLFLGKYENLREIAAIFRIFGRMAFPLFIFLLVEGIIHTRSIKDYLARLGSLALAFLIGQIIYTSFINKGNVLLSPMVDLFLTAVCVYLLKRKDKFSYFAVIPVAWSFVSLFIRNYETTNLNSVNWFPYFLRLDYGIFGPLLGIGFFYANDLAKVFLKSNKGTESFIGTTYEQTTKNVISIIVLMLLTITLCFIDNNAMRTFYSVPWQFYSILALVPILFYSGKRGYNAKWFQYGCYFYFPAHLIIIFLIFALL